MADRIATDEIARLEARVAADPAAPEFPALAEALRREGRSEDAEAVARAGVVNDPGSLEGPLVLALALIDQGRISEAQACLASRAEALLPERAAPGFGDELTDGEIEAAFDGAEPMVEELMDADRMAQEAIRGADLAEPEGGPAVADRLFATRTMADLLESQGEWDGAARIRAALESDAATAPPQHAGARGRRERIIATLEGWLDTLGRESR